MSNDEGITWKCLACEGEPEFEHDKFIEHAQSVHGIAKDAKGQRNMLIHADGREFFSSTYEWTISGLKFIQTVKTRRAHDDIMRYI